MQRHKYLFFLLSVVALPVSAEPGDPSGETLGLAPAPALTSFRGPANDLPPYGWYVGFALGLYDSDVSGGDLDKDLQGKVVFTTDSSLDQDEFAWKFFGGYRFVETPWAVEFGYADFGDTDSVIRAAPPNQAAFGKIIQGVHPLSGHGLTLAGKVHFLEQNGFSFNAKLGAWWWHASGQFRLMIPPGGTGNTFNLRERGIDPFIGLGSSYELGEGFSLRAELEAYWIDSEELYLLSLGLDYNIGTGTSGPLL